MRLAALLVIVLSLLLTGCTSGILLAKASTGNIPIGAGLDDTTMHATLTYRLFMLSHDWTNTDIEFTVYNRTALVVGYVQTKAQKEAVSNTIAATNGLDRYINLLHIGTINPPERYTEDSWITAKIKSDIIRVTNPLFVKVMTYDRNVYLMGVVYKEQADKIIALASHTEGVKSVINAMTYKVNTWPSAPIDCIKTIRHPCQL